MNNLTPKELDYQFSKISHYLKEQEAKYKKYKKYKAQLQARIQKIVKETPSAVADFPSLKIDVKPCAKAPLNEQLLKEFLESIYDSKDVIRKIMSSLNDYRTKKASTIHPSVSISIPE